MNPLIQILLSAGGATVLAALITAVMNRRKLSAEATQIITQAAAGTVENVMKDNAELRTRMAVLEAKLRDYEAAQRIHDDRERHHLLAEERYRRHSTECHDYTAILASKLRELGETVPDPPPIWRPDG